MNYCKSGSLSLILLLVFCSIAYPQYSPGKVLAFPLKYNQPHERMDLSPSQERVPYIRWQVYSDRDANVTYTTPGGNTQKTTISYMDDFYVAAEQGDYIQLVKDPDIDIMSIAASLLRLLRHGTFDVTIIPIAMILLITIYPTYVAAQTTDDDSGAKHRRWSLSVYLGFAAGGPARDIEVQLSDFALSRRTTDQLIWPVLTIQAGDIAHLCCLHLSSFCGKL